MFRLTTPTHRFIMALDPNEWSKFIISYSQNGKIILEKTEQDDFEVESLDNGASALSLKLSQEETQLFDHTTSAHVQIRCQYANGDTFASNKMSFKVNDVINDTII